MQKPFTVATLLVFLVLEKKQEVNINNCNPSERVICQQPNYWLVRVEKKQRLRMKRG